MTGQILVAAAVLAQIGCFAVIARASFRFFRQGESTAHALTRLANVAATLGFVGMALSGAGSPGGALVALGLSAVSLWIFRRAVASASAGVLPVAFAGAPSARLVTEGIYGRIRNPFYTSYLIHWAAWAALLDLAWPAVAGFAFFALLYRGAVVKEERALARQFGAAYTAYKARSGRFLPRLQT